MANKAAIILDVAISSSIELLLIYLVTTCEQ